MRERCTCSQNSESNPLEKVANNINNINSQQNEKENIQEVRAAGS